MNGQVIIWFFARAFIVQTWLHLGGLRMIECVYEKMALSQVFFVMANTVCPMALQTMAPV